MEMDWDKVIATLRQIGNNKFAEANKFSQLSGHYDMVKEARTAGEILMCFAAALSAGRP